MDRAYIEDAFNLYGLKEEVPNYNRALALILDKSGERATCRAFVLLDFCVV